MKKSLFTFTLLIFCFVGANFAQEKGWQFEFKGIVKDKNSAVFAGVPLFFKSNSQEVVVSTDINGEFSIKLLPGSYEVTFRKTISEKFIAFISIQENALNPNNVEFVIESNQLCCQTSDGKPYPKIIMLPKPLYPAAARAVRAFGEVVVSVEIDKEGKVTSANAVSGHPLLRSISLVSAKGCLFETSENDIVRQVNLTYVYLLPENDKNLSHYSNPYRIEIIGKNLIVNFSVTKTS
jgi:Gram-negative bacterial TonB protein C-terminal